jgi:ATP-dependent HslUV protease subunit HslV
MGDSQVTAGQSIVAKASAKKLRKARDDQVICGFAGSTADAITLLEKLEGKLNEYSDLKRACVELAKDWRGDKYLRRLEASMIVADNKETLEIDGAGNVMTPEEDGVLGIGSGGQYAKAAARALVDIDGLTADQIAEKAMKIATEIDVFSNAKWDKMALDASPEGPAPEGEPRKVDQNKLP